jgi:hypothetical protein
MIKNSFSTLLLAVAIVLTALILGNSFKNRNQNLDSISVTGLGTTDFISDEILWSGTFTVTSLDLKSAYNQITADKKTVTDFFITKGFKADEFAFDAVVFQKKFREIRKESTQANYQYSYEQVFDGYEAIQNITFKSKKDEVLMKKIEAVSSKTSELINSGIELTSNPIQYTYSELPGLKKDLIEKATKDASERVEKIVSTADGSLGKLKGASMGVFQITGQGSNEEFSYGGVFDTYSKNKTARITVRLEYELK